MQIESISAPLQILLPGERQERSALVDRNVAARYRAVRAPRHLQSDSALQMERVGQCLFQRQEI